MTTADVAAECQERAAAEQTEHPSNQADNDILNCLRDNERGDARLFNDLHSGRFIYDHSAGMWFKWGGQFWVEDVRQEALAGGVDAVVDAYAEEAMRQAWAAITAEKANRAEDSKRHKALQNALLKRMRDLQAVQRRRNVLTLAAAGTGLVGHEWDADPWLLAVQNGILDLRTGTLRPGRPEDYIKTAAQVEWLGIDIPCPAWENFLADIFAGDEHLTAYVQRLLGYGLIGEVLLHIIIIFWGSGRNGKGTLLEIVKHVLGDLALKAEAELLLEQRYAKASGAPNSGILALRGKRLVWVSETDEGRRLNTSRVKELVGGDTLNARGLYARRHVEFRPSHLLLLLTNNKPSAPASDFALWQRIMLVPFTQHFVNNPTRSNEHQADHNLPVKLQAESSGILAWLVRGCLEWQRQGLNPPEAVKVATEEYRQDEDLVGHFLEDCCVIAPTAQVKAGDLFTAYKEWCTENNCRTLGHKRFGEDIRARDIDSYKDRVTYFVGIGLAAESA